MSNNTKTPLPFPPGQYSVIYADPPWPMRKSKRRVRPSQVELDYPTMSVSEIQSLPVATLTLPDATLFLWTTHRFLPAALDVLTAWGFRYQRVVTWDKQNGMCLHGFHQRTELLLFGYRGRLPVYPTRKAFPTVIVAKSPRHSEKPSVFRTWIEPFGTPRLELFARQEVPGWVAWGNEVSPNEQRP